MGVTVAEVSDLTRTEELTHAMIDRMPAKSDSYDAAVSLAGNRNYHSIISYLRENPASYRSDILDGAGVPLGSLGRALRELVTLEILTIDVQPEKQGTGRNYRYTVNEARVRRLVAALETELLGR